MRIKLLIAVIVVGVAGIFLWSYQLAPHNRETESFGPRAEAFQACATADIPLVSVDTVLDTENGSVEVRWSDPETGEEKFLLLPYDPLNSFKGCSDSAKRVLQHVSNADMFPTEIPTAVALARTFAAQRVKVNENEDEVAIVSVVQKDWPNACLGMPGNTPEDEFCAEMITPGYEVTLKAQGRKFIYRTNMEGTQIRPAN